MATFLADSTGPLEDFASIGGYADFRAWAREQDAPLKRFAHDGFTEDLEELVEALSKATATPTVREQVETLLECAKKARDVIIVSDGMSDEDLEVLGGPGSGNFGHGGRPGEIGGSSSEGGEKKWRDYTPEERGAMPREQYWKLVEEKEKEDRARLKEEKKNLPPGWKMYYDENLGGHVKSDLPKAQAVGAISYVTGEYGDLNEDLRYGSPVRDRSLVKNLDAATKVDSAEENMVVYRVVSAEHAPKEGIFEDRAYVSTSRSRELAEKFGEAMTTDATVLEITIPRGMTFLDVDKHVGAAGNDPEEEILLPRGLRFEVTGPGRMRIVR